MVVRGKLPRHVVVRRFSILRIMLRREQVDRIVSVGLIEPHHIRSSRKASFLKLDGPLRPRNLNVLSHQPPDHRGYPRGISLIRWNQKCIRRLCQSFMPGVPRFLIEIVQHLFGFA